MSTRCVSAIALFFLLASDPFLVCVYKEHYLQLTFSNILWVIDHIKKKTEKKKLPFLWYFFYMHAHLVFKMTQTLWAAMK